MVAERRRVESLAELQAALDAGWHVEPPVYTFTDRRKQRLVYQFILWRTGQPCVATIYDDPPVRQFIAAHGFHLEPLL